jgi:hypothetical protein
MVPQGVARSLRMREVIRSARFSHGQFVLMGHNLTWQALAAQAKRSRVNSEVSLAEERTDHDYINELD